MKAFKIVLIIVGFALTSISFGQLLSQSDGSVLFYTVQYNAVNSQLIHTLEEYPDRWTSGDQFVEPLSARTYFEPFEAELPVESWMLTPFESNYYEEGPFMESWMTEPFADSYYEEDLAIETWMTHPFETEEDLKVEAWMTSSWI
jgi:hypothetical protein